MTVLTIQQALDYAHQAGFFQQQANNAVAVAMTESGLDTTATNTAGNTPPSTDRGLMQINSYWHSEVTDQCAFDPLCAMRAAYVISKQGTDFSPWSTWGSGAYLRYLPMVDNIAAGGVSMAETMSEFGQYTGDCVWDAVLMGAHKRNLAGWPLTFALLNRLTSEAIAANIGVGPRGEADTMQLETMMTRWGIKWQRLYNGGAIDRATLANILDSWLGPGSDKPVVLGMSNGQALTGDEVGLHGHEIVVLHPYDPAHGGYPCGDGDSQAARNGQFSYYSADMLVAAQVDSAYAILEAPDMGTITISLSDPTVAGYFAAGVSGSWVCKKNGVALSGGLLTAYQSWPSEGTLAGLTAFGLPLKAIVYHAPPTGKQAAYSVECERGVLAYDPDRLLDSPPGIVGSCYAMHKEYGVVAPAPPPPPPPVLKLGTPTAVLQGNELVVTQPFTIGS